MDTFHWLYVPCNPDNKIVIDGEKINLKFLFLHMDVYCLICLLSVTRLR